MKRYYFSRLLLGVILVALLLSAVFAGASIEAARTAPAADIILPINHSTPQGIVCADGGVLFPAYDEDVTPSGNRIEMWCLPFHPGGKAE